MKNGLLIAILFSVNVLHAQFAPGPNQEGSTAIFKDSTAISFWANAAIIKRGWQDIADTTLGKASVGEIANVIGVANSEVVSLGDGGEIVLTFEFPIYNVDGFDFAVFENGFSAGANNEFFLELAFVEVSDDGENFVRFDAVSNTNTTTNVGSFDNLNCTNLHNLAGKYPGSFGTPFDLDELSMDSITHIKLIDVVGTIDDEFATYDFYDNKINDPYPTDFPSGGFDLDGVAALNQPNQDTTTMTAVHSFADFGMGVFPNSFQNELTITVDEMQDIAITIYNVIGEVILQDKMMIPTQIDLSFLEKGVYFMEIRSKSTITTEKIIKN